MTPQGKEVMKMFLRLAFYLGAPFVKDNFDIPAFFNRLEDAGMGNWHTGGCSECSGCGSGEAEDCQGVAAQWILGTPALLDGDTPYNGTVTTESDSVGIGTIHFHLGALYEVTISNVQTTGVDVYVHSYDCDDNEVCAQNVNDGGVVTGEEFKITTNISETATVTLSFRGIASTELGCS